MLINTYEPIAVNIIDVQLPVFNARCTSGSFDSLLLTRIRKVPIIENRIPTPAIIRGRRIGPIPNASPVD